MVPPPKPHIRCIPRQDRLNSHRNVYVTYEYSTAISAASSSHERACGLARAIAAIIHACSSSAAYHYSLTPHITVCPSSPIHRSPPCPRGHRPTQIIRFAHRTLLCTRGHRPPHHGRRPACIGRDCSSSAHHIGRTAVSSSYERAGEQAIAIDFSAQRTVRTTTRPHASALSVRHTASEPSVRRPIVRTLIVRSSHFITR